MYKEMYNYGMRNLKKGLLANALLYALVSALFVCVLLFKITFVMYLQMVVCISFVPVAVTMTFDLYDYLTFDNRMIKDAEGNVRLLCDRYVFVGTVDGVTYMYRCNGNKITSISYLRAWSSQMPRLLIQKQEVAGDGTL